MIELEIEYIRNFCIIAHIDHGKSTLADRFLEITGAVEPEKIKPQYLDLMELEREKGITIKAQAVRMFYSLQGILYELNLIDTPGHVDFSYEVSRTLEACEGAILLVDASQGVEAQTIGNLNFARNAGLTIIPVINKIDLPTARPEIVSKEVADILGINPSEIHFCSAKTGEGVTSVLEAVIRRVPSPKGDPLEPLKALVFDSKYDQFRGVVAFIRIFTGTLKAGDEIFMMEKGTRAHAETLGYFSPEMEPSDSLGPGEVGFVATGIKDVSMIPVGDTLTTVKDSATEPLPGYEKPKPVVFAGFFPVDNSDYQQLRDALAKLRLNDSSFTYEPETSQALGFGFRCGFLGLLHMEIVRERLEREYELEIIITAPNVVYRVTEKSGKSYLVNNPSQMPTAGVIQSIEEPFVSLLVITPSDVVGPVMELCSQRRCVFRRMEYISENRVEIHYEMPLSEMVANFYDQLKSRSRGYASMDYEFLGFRKSPLVKLEILVHGEIVDAFSTIVTKDEAQARARELISRLKKHIPRQLFEVAVQASVGGRIIARETIPARRKDVTAKCYGGDITRKRKLWEKQKAGKKRMKMVGKVELPQEAFISVITDANSGK